MMEGFWNILTKMPEPLKYIAVIKLVTAPTSAVRVFLTASR